MPPSGPNEMPYVHISVGTGSDGRISPKLISMDLLDALNHPIFSDFGDINHYGYYLPSRFTSEASMNVAIRKAYKHLNVTRSIVDECHHVTYTKDPTLRKGVLDGLKCISALDRTLVTIGGYELAYSGFFDSSHFAGRLVVVEFPPYTNSAEDLDEWKRILTYLSQQILISPKSLLLDEAERLLQVTNGSFGLLEKLLWFARAIGRGKAITESVLRAAEPSKSEQNAIRKDINQGREALTKYAMLKPKEVSKESDKPKADKRKPFKCNPNRELPTLPVLGND